MKYKIIVLCDGAIYESEVIKADKEEYDADYARIQTAIGLFSQTASPGGLEIPTENGFLFFPANVISQSIIKLEIVK